MSDLELSKVILRNSSDDGAYAEFVVDPLERGFGTTIGNSLRRALLSSIPGFAASSIKIDGVTHEFSTVPGVLEDVTDIVLNVKGIIVRLEGCDSKTVYVDIKGPCEFTADMIETDSDFKILSNNLIATLEEDSELKMEITFTSGVGYVSANENRAIMPAIMNIIPVDSIYSPVLRVNYKVEDTRVGQITDYDKLTFQVWTNGVISAQDAVSLASKNLIEHLGLFCISETSMKVGSKSGGTGLIPSSSGDFTLDDLGFSVRTYNALKRAGFEFLSQLLVMKPEEILGIRNLGKKSYDEMVAKLKSFGWKYEKPARKKKVNLETISEVEEEKLEE